MLLVQLYVRTVPNVADSEAFSYDEVSAKMATGGLVQFTTERVERIWPCYLLHYASALDHRYFYIRLACLLIDIFTIFMENTKFDVGTMRSANNYVLHLLHILLVTLLF